MTKLKLVLLLLIFSVSLRAQQRKYCDSLDFNAQYINPIFRKHIETFILEAKKRNVPIDLSCLKICVHCQIHPYYFKYLAGYAFRNFNKIEIDTTALVWRVNQEMLVFHELGHLVLGREHCNNLNQSRRKIIKRKKPLSIMNDNVIIIYENSEVRDWYLDELFGIVRDIPNKKSGFAQGILSKTKIKTRLLDENNNRITNIKKGDEIVILDFESKTNLFYVAYKKLNGFISWTDVILTDDMIKMINSRRMGFDAMDDAYLRKFDEQ